MFAWIIGSSLKFRFMVLAVAATLLVLGTQQLRNLPVNVFPEFAPPKVEIQSEGPGTSPPAMARTAASPGKSKSAISNCCSD